MKSIHKQTVYIASVLFVAFLIPSFFAAWSEDEGTLGTNIVWVSFAKLFYILRFPTHTLFWPLLTKNGVVLFFSGLLINCLLYGLLTERVIYIIKRLIKSQAGRNLSS